MPGDKIEVPVWLIPKRGQLDKLIQKGVKVPAYIFKPFQDYAASGKGTSRGSGGSISRGIKEGESPDKNPLTKFLKLYKFDLFWKWVKGTWNVLMKYVPLMKGIADGFAAAFSMILTALVLPFLGDILAVLRFVLDVASKILNFSAKFGDTIRDAVITGLGILIANPGFLFKMIEWFVRLTAIVGQYIPYIEKLGGLFKFLGVAVQFLSKGLLGTFLRLINPFMWISLIADILKVAVGAIFGTDNPLYAFLDLVSQVSDVLGLLISGFKDLLSVIGIGAGGNIKSFFGNIMKSGETFGKQIGLADGGVVTSPTNALIGEAGAEAVIPLDKMKGMGTTINVSGIVDERKFREIVQSVVNQSLQRTNNVRGSAF